MFIARIELRILLPQRDSFRHYAASDGLTPRTFAGCVDYSFCEDVAEPSRVLLYEEWKTRDAFEAYKASPVFSAVGARLRSMLAEPPKSAYYESDDVFATCAAEPVERRTVSSSSTK